MGGSTLTLKTHRVFFDITILLAHTRASPVINNIDYVQSSPEELLYKYDREYQRHVSLLASKTVLV